MNSFPIPDFIVVGTQTDGWVILYASKNLTYAELSETLKARDILDRNPFDQDIYDMKISADVRDYVTVRGRTYSEAWQTLFAIWNPESERLDRVLEIESYPEGYPELGG